MGATALELWNRYKLLHSKLSDNLKTTSAKYCVANGYTCIF
jgi:hypothetical protein